MNLPASHLLSLQVVVEDIYNTSTIPDFISIQVVSLVTDFTAENGSTAIVPGSHVNPRHPDIREDFFSRCIQVSKDIVDTYPDLDIVIQVEAKAGDVLMFSGPIQHCAMPNKSDHVRSAVDITDCRYHLRYLPL